MDTRNQQGLDIIRKILQDFPKGASLKEILQASKLKISSRTLLRRLEILIEKKEVSRLKAGRSSIYKINESHVTPAPFEISESTISLSTESKIIYSQIHKPQEQRSPVSYHREFLENYIPNEDSYLKQDEKSFWRRLARPVNQSTQRGHMPETY